MISNVNDCKNENRSHQTVLIDDIINKMNLLLVCPDHEGEDVEMHKIKSLLYAAIERTGLELNRLHTIQRLLRELLGLLSIHQDIRGYEREAGIQILSDLRKHYDWVI